MLFSNLAEFAIIVGFLLCQLLIRKHLPKGINKLVLLIGSVLILSTVVTAVTLVLHIGIALGIFFISKEIISKGWKISKLLAFLSVVGVILLFCIRTFPSAFGVDSFQLGSTPNSLIERIGMSYIMFRHIQFIVDSLKGRIKQFHFLDYINFILFFPNFLAGPIDKYNHFKGWMDKADGKIKKALLLPGIGRIVLGFIKKFVLVPLIYVYAINYEVLMEGMTFLPAILLSLFYYSLYIYLDFSGYSDIAIGSGYIMGIKTPENFRIPYLSTNIADFWKRWHMTFSEFLRNLVFKPIVTFLTGLKIKLPRLSVSVIGYLLTFVICGFWHGATPNFGYWGLWHGIGLSVYKIWSVAGISAKLKQFLVKKKIEWLGQATAFLLTFSFVTIGWVFFNYSAKELQTILNLLFA